MRFNTDKPVTLYINWLYRHLSLEAVIHHKGDDQARQMCRLIFTFVAHIIMLIADFLKMWFISLFTKSNSQYSL